MTIWCRILVGNEKELEDHDLHTWLRGVFFTLERILAPNEWWLSNRAVRDIAFKYENSKYKTFLYSMLPVMSQKNNQMNFNDKYYTIS